MLLLLNGPNLFISDIIYDIVDFFNVLCLNVASKFSAIIKVIPKLAYFIVISLISSYSKNCKRSNVSKQTRIFGVLYLSCMSVRLLSLSSAIHNTKLQSFKNLNLSLTVTK